MVRDTPPYGHAPTYQIVRFLSKTLVYEVSILACINILQCSRVVYTWCSELIYQIVVPIVQRNYSERIQCQGNS
jgi:uncharacterized protein involved in tolerance to divalent cations